VTITPMKQTPRAAQSERIQRFLAEPTKAALVADDPGFGKTLVAVEVAQQFDRVLIIGVKDTAHQFADLFSIQTEGRITLRRIDSTKPGKAALADMLAGNAGHFFVGAQFLTTQDWGHEKQFNADGTPKYVVKADGTVTDKQESVRVHLKTYAKMKPMDLIVFDEIHMVQNRKSVGIRTLRTIKTEWKLGMSGTPYGNKFPGIWAIARWLWPEIIDASFIRWSDEWCTKETVYLGGGKSTEQIVGEKEPGKFVSTLPLYIRAEAERVPPAVEVYVDLTPAQRRQYSELEADLVTWLGEHPLVVDLPVQLRQRLRTATLGEMSATVDGEIYFDLNCKSSKLQALAGILGHWGNQPAIIGTDSKRFAKVVHARMLAAGEKVALWTGDVSSVQRDQIKADFLAGDGRVQYIVATIASMSTGLDGFQKVCSKLAILSELDGNEAVNEQFVRRLFRPGRVGEFQWVRILAKDTKDAGVLGANLARSLTNRVTLRHAA
jgi:superfamily II DNA or RNA helicase